MTEILKLISLTSIWVIGLKIATADDMLLQSWREYAEKKVNEGKKIFEPLIVCQWCMPSIHSLVGYFFAFMLDMISLSWKLVWMYPLVVMGSSLLSGMTWLVYETINAIRDKAKIEARYKSHCEKMAYWDMTSRTQKHQHHGSKKEHKGYTAYATKERSGVRQAD